MTVPDRLRSTESTSSNWSNELLEMLNIRMINNILRIFEGIHRDEEESADNLGSSGDKKQVLSDA